MRRSRGFSLVEILVALAILAIVITTTIAMFAERTRRLREANETILAFQALSNEAEYWRRQSFAQIDDPTTEVSVRSAILAPLTPYTTAVKVDTPRADVRNVTLTIRWARTAKRTSRIARADTGGSGLW